MWFQGRERMNFAMWQLWMSTGCFITTQNQSNRVHNGQLRHHQFQKKKKPKLFMVLKNLWYWGFSVSAHCISKPHCYSSVLPRSLAKKYRRFQKKKHPHKKVQEILLHHDNALKRVAHTTTKFLEKRGIRTVSHFPYSPDLNPCDFRLFSEIEKVLCGVRFESSQHIIKAVEARWKDLSKNGLLFVFQSGRNSGLC